MAERDPAAAFGEPGKKAKLRNGGAPKLNLRALLVLPALAGFVGSAYALFKGMNELIGTSGGICASGSPYQVAEGHQCTGGETLLLIGGIFGLLAFAALLGWALGGVSNRIDSVTGYAVAWFALFGVLGAAFIVFGLRGSVNIGLLIGGVTLLAMAVPALLYLVKEGLDPIPERTSSPPSTPLVRASSAPAQPEQGAGGPPGAANTGAPKRLVIPPGA